MRGNSPAGKLRQAWKTSPVQEIVRLDPATGSGQEIQSETIVTIKPILRPSDQLQCSVVAGGRLHPNRAICSTMPANAVAIAAWRPPMPFAAALSTKADTATAFVEAIQRALDQ